MTIVTALRPTPAGVVVELDGVVWRTLPVDAVVDAGLGVGLVLDRARAVALARARRRSRADDVAVRALARREHSRTTLDARLEYAVMDPPFLLADQRVTDTCARAIEVV